MKILPPLLFGLLTFSVSAAEPNDQLSATPDGKELKLIWQDEFEGDELDETKWEARPDGKRKGGWWSPKAVSVDGDGHLVITTFMDDGKPTTGCVWTKGKFEHSFGYYVARVKFQKQPGHWSAFWMNGVGIGKIGDAGRDGTKIDILEKPWLNDRVQHALHWGEHHKPEGKVVEVPGVMEGSYHWVGFGEHHKSEGKVVEVPGVMERWHTFGLLWLSDEYIFYVDGKETWRSKAGGVCQVPQYMLLSDEIGDWGGDISEAKLPDRFLVDYVRVYDLVDAE